MNATWERLAEGLVVLTVQGNVHVYSAPAFKESLGHCLALAPHRLLVDLSDSEFIDSGQNRVTSRPSVVALSRAA